MVELDETPICRMDTSTTYLGMIGRWLHLSLDAMCTFVEDIVLGRIMSFLEKYLLMIILCVITRLICV
jgi:hypothetical protein